MATIIIAALIALAVGLSIRHTIYQKGSCGDCHVDCLVREQMPHSHKEG